MQLFEKQIKFGGGLLILFFLTSCLKDEKMENDIQSESILQNYLDTSWMNYPMDTLPGELSEYMVDLSCRTLNEIYPASSYVSIPDKNVYQNAPTSSISSGATTYFGGPFQSSVSLINSNIISFKLKRTDGVSFPIGSVIRIKWSGVGGEIRATRTLTASASNISMDVIETTKWNINNGKESNQNNWHNYIITWYNPVSKLNFYTQAIKIVAVPTGWGVGLASLNGVNVYSNGWGGFKSTDYLTDYFGQKYQCVHFIKRYYTTIYNRDLGNGNANVYWDDFKAHNLKEKVLNGAGNPKQGDIICFYSTNGSFHVGIVAGIYGGRLRVYQENVGQVLKNGNYCSGFKDFNYTTTKSGINVNPDMLGTSWTTLGWVR